MIEVLKKYQELYPGWQWLLRSDESKGYFCNLTSPDFRAWIGGDNEGQSFHAWAETPEKAFQDAFNQLWEGMVI